ncbi:MAG: hypothetical protein ACKOXU_05035 [Limnohabitans sp.]
MEKVIFGHIDCPTCGVANGMRITHDKNGDPFGYCEAECGQQLRIGGDKRRSNKFLARFPWAAGSPPVTETGKEPVTVTAPEPTPAAAKAKPKASPFDLLAQFNK